MLYIYEGSRVVCSLVLAFNSTSIFSPLSLGVTANNRRALMLLLIFCRRIFIIYGSFHHIADPYMDVFWKDLREVACESAHLHAFVIKCPGSTHSDYNMCPIWSTLWEYWNNVGRDIVFMVHAAIQPKNLFSALFKQEESIESGRAKKFSHSHLLWLLCSEVHPYKLETNWMAYRICHG